MHIYRYVDKSVDKHIGNKRFYLLKVKFSIEHFFVTPFFPILPIFQSRSLDELMSHWAPIDKIKIRLKNILKQGIMN